MRKLTLLISLLCALFFLGGCTKERGEGAGPVPETNDGDLVATLQGLPKRATLASFDLGGQTSDELLVGDSVYVYLFRSQTTGAESDETKWHLVYTVRAKDIELLPATPQVDGNSTTFSATFPLFNQGEKQRGEVFPGADYKAVYVVNQGIDPDVSLSWSDFTSELESSLTIDNTGTTLRAFKLLASAPTLSADDRLMPAFVMFGQSDNFRIYGETPSNSGKTVLTRVAARIDITNKIGNAIVEVKWARVMRSADRGALGNVPRGASGIDARYTVAPASLSLIDQGRADNVGFDRTLGKVGGDKNYMWGHLYTYPTYNGMLEELQEGDPLRDQIELAASTGDTTATWVELNYNLWSQGNAMNFTTPVYFRNGEDTVFIDPANKAAGVRWYPLDPVRIDRNHRYEIVIDLKPDDELPSFTVVAMPWTDSLAVDTAEVVDAALSLTFDGDAMNTRQITFVNNYPVSWGGTLSLPATRTSPADSFNFSIGYESSYAALTIEKPDWVNIENYPGASPTLADNAAGGFKGRLDVHITNNPLMPREGRLEISNQERKYTYIISQAGDGTFAMRRSANSFIVAPGQKIVFPASRANADGQTRLAANDTITVEVLWADGSGVLTSANVYVQGVGPTALIGVARGATNGNAVVVARKKATGTIVWSWHIWATDYDPNAALASVPDRFHGTRLQRAAKDGAYAATNGYVFRYTGAGRNTQTSNADRSQMNAEGSLVNDEYGIYDATNVFMDRNLGALNATPGDAGSKGLLYQWGRKDPFPGSVGWTTDEPTTIRNGADNANLGNFAVASPGTAAIAANTWTNNFIVKMRDDNADIAAWKTANGDGSNNNNNYAIAHPSALIYGQDLAATGYDWYTAVNDRAAQNDSLWGWTLASNMNYRKSVYDPCPDGWRVPKNGAWQGLDDDDTPAGNASIVEREYAFIWRGAPFYGRYGFGGLPDAVHGVWQALPNWMAASWEDPTGFDMGGASEWSAATVGYYPAAGGRYGTSGDRVGGSTYGYYWTSSRYSSDYPLYVFYMEFSAVNVFSSYPGGRSACLTVRCVQEE